MDYIPYRQIPDVLSIREGDTLLLTSDILSLALAAEDHQEIFEPKELIDSLRNRLTRSGTLLIPAFNFDFCSGRPFDIIKSASTSGALSRAALQDTEFQRTQHPIHSFAVWGKDAPEYLRMQNKSSFGSNSPFGLLHERNAQFLIIGLEYNSAFTFVHYVEEREGVPYRYLKEFKSDYIDRKGRKERRSYSMYVRDLNRRVESQVNPMGMILEQKGIATKRILNGVSFISMRLGDAYGVIEADIRQNEGRSLFLAP